MFIDDPDDPGLISLTKLVPDSVPSVIHNSLPLLPSLALKNKLLFKTHKIEAPPEPETLIFITNDVPDSVPSVLHNS
mgnify:CR=1 FL=1